MNTNPLVSLIVPCYNIAGVCDRFFESLLRQTYSNIQLILVNDGSVDGTETKLFSYKDKLEEKGYRFEYYFQENKGLGGAINTGLKKIKGEYLCWADPDDFYEDNAFEIRVNYFESHSDCMALTCDAYIRSSENISEIVGQECSNFKHHNEPKQFKYLLDYDSVLCPGIHMIRTEVFKKANPLMDIYEARHGQNWQMLLPVYYFFERRVLQNAIYNYVIYENSMSHRCKSYNEKLSRIEENSTIQIETLKRIEMTDDERNVYIRHIELFHDKLKMYLARDNGKKSEYMVMYSKLKKEHNVDFKDMLRKYKYLLLGK